MARRRRRSQRDTNVVSNSVAVIPSQSLYLRPPAPLHRTHLQHIEDRREWHPQDLTVRPAGTISRAARTRLTTKPVSPLTAHRLSHTVVFSRPSAVAICNRRQARRNVLFALKRTGKGSRSRKRHYTEHSRTSCRG